MHIALKGAFILVPLLIISVIPFYGSDGVSFLTPPPRAKVLFLGDMMFDRTIRNIADQKGADFIFSCMKDVLNDHDVVVLNLEGPVTNNPSKSVGTRVGDPLNTRFTFPAYLPSVLASHNIRFVSLGNNHIYDFGGEGIDETRELLSDAGISFVGDPRDSLNTSGTMYVRGVPLTLVSFNEFFGDEEETVRHIEKTEGTSVVFAHWGDEYVKASKRQEEWAEKFVLSGADMVIGHHPHVVQGNEVINKAPVYYSLGNFIFDQYWNEEVSSGLGLSVTLSNEGIERVDEIPLSIGRDGRTCPSELKRSPI